MKEQLLGILQDAVYFSQHIKGNEQRVIVAIATTKETGKETTTFNFKRAKHEKANATVLLKGIAFIEKVGIGLIFWDQLIASLRVYLLWRCFWFIENKNVKLATF